MVDRHAFGAVGDVSLAGGDRPSPAAGAKKRTIALQLRTLREMLAVKLRGHARAA